MPELWDRLLTALRRRIPHQDVEVWLETSQAVELREDDTLVLEVVNEYYADWIRDNYLSQLELEARALIGRPVRFELMPRQDTTEDGPAVALLPTDGPQPQVQPRGTGVNPNQTFGNFVVGECNKFAHAAAQAVADRPAESYNPLFIYGGTGLGKTHLMHAVANHILGHDPASRVVYVTAEDFMNEMINGLRYKRMDDFRAKYRKRSSVLLVDDIQFLSGKERTQEEFFHTFNTLQGMGRQIVLTSDVAPNEIKALEPRLRTRFAGGLLADMQAPDRETLLAILAQKADNLELLVPNDVADAIANQVAGNIRELEGILNRLKALVNFYNEPISLGFVRRHMPNVFAPPQPHVTVPTIIEAVARLHNLRSADLTGSRRTRNLVRPRQIAMYLARRYTDLSFPDLGREFGGRDHSTIQHGVKRIEKELKSDPDMAYKIRLIEQNLSLRGVG